MTDVPRSTPTKPKQKIDTYDARDIVKDGVQACIVLDDQTYYLRITRAGKLILTK
ncbi:MAG: hemin uptake protein HemP [Litoreibacter sp.]|nr:hemin uptake protein HemP [Litoreibacter sp.]